MKETKPRIGRMYPIIEVEEKEVEIVGGSSKIKDREKEQNKSC